jgi:hypothetical protein
MWIFCGGMFRSGSTVQFQIASHLAEHFGRGERLTWRNAEDFAAVRAECPADGRLRVFKAHHLSAAIRAELAETGGLVITTHRDIRDVVASAIRKNGWSFRHIWKHRMLARWTGRFDEWAALPGALVSRYDHLVADLGAEAVRIGRLIGVDVSADLAATIAKAYAVERQQERAADVRVRRDRRQLATKYDAHSLLHHNHITSGEVGGYRRVLRPAEIRLVEAECGEWMRRWGYPPADVDLGLLDRAHATFLRMVA